MKHIREGSWSECLYATVGALAVPAAAAEPDWEIALPAGVACTFPLTVSTETMADGSSTTVLTGHTVVIMFPTDVPAGPTTTLYTGRVVIDADASGVSTIVAEAGRALDVCAALTPAG